MRRKLLALGSLACVTLLATACGESSGPEGKGPEEEPLLADGKVDSFVKPTDHGALAFGVGNQAVVDASQRFHAWTFKLSGPARVSLRTEVSTNLDTVMYLYRRDSEAVNYGANIAKNDDFQGAIWSQIDHEATGPGDYRVIVKPYKVSLVGGFSLIATCEGPGCPGAGGEVCTPETEGSYPPDSGFGRSCAGQLHAVLSAKVTAESSHSVTVAERCQLGPAARSAVESYIGYWDGLVGWEELAYDDEEVVLNVHVEQHGTAGTRVTVDLGGDEDTLVFVMDATGRTLLTYHSEQSPTALWGCRAEGEDAAEEPDVWCVSAALYDDPASVLTEGPDGVSFSCE